MATSGLRTPTQRSCECCGRREVWDPDCDCWQLDVDDGTKTVGDPHCIHEWDINGTFRPFG